ncbi:MAG TPA: Ig-like domain repeat protein, partial [Microbacterium sp.]|nr:Ig-like domain repeat protein [Microbacterium sp.]
VDDQAQPVSTSLRLSSPDVFVKAGRSATVKVAVSAEDGSAPVGTVTVRDAGKVVATVGITAADRGKVAVDLPKLTRGLHLVTATFEGSEPYSASRSRLPLPVLAY